jgi:DinB superfamily
MKETFEEYTARLLGLAAGSDPIAVLASTPDRIAALIDGRPLADLRRRPSADRWSIAEIVHHLADAEIVFAYRARMILSAPGTALQAYDQDAWSRAQRAADTDPHASLALFRALRTAMLSLLSRLTEEELDRYGMHAERGRESMRHLKSLHAGHDRNHLAQIEQLAA